MYKIYLFLKTHVSSLEKLMQTLELTETNWFIINYWSWYIFKKIFNFCCKFWNILLTWNIQLHIFWKKYTPLIFHESLVIKLSAKKLIVQIICFHSSQFLYSKAKEYSSSMDFNFDTLDLWPSTIKVENSEQKSKYDDVKKVDNLMF